MFRLGWVLLSPITDSRHSDFRRRLWIASPRNSAKAARADLLNDFGDNAPTNWEYPFGTGDMHIGLSIFSRDDQSLEAVLEQARQGLESLPQISVIYRLKFHSFPDGRNPFGFKDGLRNPHVEGSGTDPPPGYRQTVKAGEFPRI